MCERWARIRSFGTMGLGVTSDEQFFACPRLMPGELILVTGGKFAPFGLNGHCSARLNPVPTIPW